MRKAQAVVAVLCDHQCHARGPLDSKRLEKELAETGLVQELLVLKKACGNGNVDPKGLKGQKVIFAGCPHLEDSGYFGTLAGEAGLRPGEYLISDVRSTVFDLYDDPRALTHNLARRLDSLAQLLTRSEGVSDRPGKLKEGILVLGSGLSALSVARELDREGHPVDLVEIPEPPLAPGCLGEMLGDPLGIGRLKEQVLGGESTAVFPADLAGEFRVEDTGFAATIGGAAREYGAVVFAPERVEAPSGEVGAWNLTQLYGKLAAGQTVKGRVVFVLDRESETPAPIVRDVLLAARHLKERFRSEVYVLLKQVRVAMPALEEMYDTCRDLGVVFIKYGTLTLENDFGDITLRGSDPQSGAAFTLERPERVILPSATGLSPAARKLAGALGLRTTDSEYSQPDSLWRLPNQTNRPGIMVSGSSRESFDSRGVREDAASTVLGLHERFAAPGLAVVERIAEVDADKCAYCLTCVRVCPFGAMGKDSVERVAKVTKTACQACGICAAECPASAIELRNLAMPAIGAAARALL
jgi:heterodisulfide reductase subunit A-like polyferredoxin